MTDDHDELKRELKKLQKEIEALRDLMLDRPVYPPRRWPYEDFMPREKWPCYPPPPIMCGDEPRIYGSDPL